MVYSRRSGPFALVVLALSLLTALPAPISGQAARPRPARPAPQASPAAPLSPRRLPKLVVILVVDQMRADYVEKFGSTWTGGLRRLMTEGAWFREAAYPYLTTVTCAGHSTIVTGSLPATHGIISNSWWDRASGNVMNCVADPEQKVVSYGQPVSAEIAGTSTKNLRVPTLPDEMRAQMRVPPRVVTISLKDYTATTMAGRQADAATWFNPGAHSWRTTTAFTKEPVPFIAQFIKEHPIEADYGKTWMKLLPETAYLYQDDQVGEDTDTWTRTFPHVLKGKGDQPDLLYYVQWDTSPFSDHYLGEMAEYAAESLKLGQGQGTDYLAISFSALDMVGHDFGPRSQEVQDVLAQLDRTIGALLSHLDNLVGKGNYVLALAADHGVAPIPEQMSAIGVSAGRVLLQDVMRAGNKALEDTMGPGSPQISRIVYNEVYFAPGDWPKVAAKPEAARALLEAIRSVPGIARVFRGDQLADVNATAEDRTELAALWSYFPGRSGDLILVPRPYFLYSASPTTVTGTGHGSPYDYDQHVPLFLFGQGIKPGQYLTGASPVDIAPTLAFLCGVTLPAVDGRVLNEALAPLPAPGEAVK